MLKTRITVRVNASILKSAMQYTGKGITETINEALQLLAARQAGKELLKLQGKLKSDINLKELRKDKPRARR